MLDHSKLLWQLFAAGLLDPLIAIFNKKKIFTVDLCSNLPLLPGEDRACDKCRDQNQPKQLWGEQGKVQYDGDGKR